MKHPIAPNPRYRLYTTAGAYFRFFSNVLTKQLHRERGEVEVLEQELGLNFHVPHVVAMPMARVAIHFAVKNLIKPGQHVLMSPYTIADVVNMVIAAGGIPKFCDIDRKTCNISVDSIKKNLGPDSAVVLITHLHGLAAPIKEIAELCKTHGLSLVEDAAQAFGAELEGKKLGTFGDAGVYSFGTYKNINAWFGGALVTSNGILAQKVRAEISNFPFQSASFLRKRIFKSLKTDILTYPLFFKALTFWIFRYAFLKDIEFINKQVRTELDLNRRDTLAAEYQTRLTPYQACLARSQLQSIDAASDVRIAKSRLYHEGLKNIPGLILPPESVNRSHIYTYYPIQYEKRDELLKWLMAHRCDVAAQHLKNCADLPSFSAFKQECPNARATANQVILLPTYPRYGNADVERNIAVIQDYFNRVPRNA